MTLKTLRAKIKRGEYTSKLPWPGYHSDAPDMVNLREEYRLDSKQLKKKFERDVIEACGLNKIPNPKGLFNFVARDMFDVVNDVRTLETIVERLSKLSTLFTL